MKQTVVKNGVVTCCLALVATGIASCASSAGDDVTCPECDNVSELLVGNTCVPTDQVETCGPDGHPHGDECHCFSGQQPTEIGGIQYCLQTGCTAAPQEDLNAHACEHLEETPETVSAVDDFASFEEAHADLETLVEIGLPSSGTGYVHFPGRQTGHVLVLLGTTGVFSAAYDATHNALTSENLGPNEDCSSDLPEVWEVQVENDTDSVQPQILELTGTGTVRVVILEE